LNRHIRTVDDVLSLLDGLFAPEADRWTEKAGDWWDRFYADRSREVPFFVAKPDENLVSYLERGLITPGRALDVGCGPGRNAIFLARHGFQVDAVDLSATAIAWARERAEGLDVRFRQGDAFTSEGSYDLIYDSGCFHHLPPHRRISYLALLDRALEPGGHFALTCFTADEGTATPDAELYRQRGLSGGVGYQPDDLRWIFSDHAEVELRRMTEEPAQSPVFGKAFLWTALFRAANGRARPAGGIDRGRHLRK
jgi:SAM-dependent methyltransferase